MIQVVIDKLWIPNLLFIKQKKKVAIGQHSDSQP
jgi:hypothetical protein